MLTRSNWGLTNRSRFTSTQFTLYVEGGGGNAHQGSADVVFWGAVFHKFRPEISLTIVALGGKPELETIARKVASSQVSNTLVAMDADFDELLGEKIISTSVIYTYGYSWENDVFYGPSLVLAIERIMRVSSLPGHVLTPLVSSVEAIMTRLRRFVNVDFYLRQLKKSLFPQLSPGSFISYDQGSLQPLLNSAVLARKYREMLRQVPVSQRKNRPNCSIIDAASYTQGHTIFFLMRRVVAFALRAGGRTMTINEDLLLQAIIPAFCEATLGVEYPIKSYYSNMMANVGS